MTTATNAETRAGSEPDRGAARIRVTHRPTLASATGFGTTLQRLPNSMLRSLSATSVGLAAGFYLARAPRLMIAAGAAPAVIMAAAMILRPIEPVAKPDETGGI